MRSGVVLCYTGAMRASERRAVWPNFFKFYTAAHAAVSCCLALLGFTIAPVWLVVSSVIAIGVAKEIFDSLRPKDYFDFIDITADVFGVLAAYGVWQLGRSV